MTDLALLRQCRELIAYYATEYEIGDEASELQHWPMGEVERCQQAVSLRNRLDAALADHAAPPEDQRANRVADEAVAAPASVSPQAPTADCPCLRCTKERTPTTKAGWPIETSRMFVCETCGNKRCPHSDWHGNPCSGSNNPGQPGSRYGGTAAGADWVPVPRDRLVLWHRVMLQMSPYSSSDYEGQCASEMGELLSAAPRPDAGEGLVRKIVVKAQDILAEYIVPDSGISDHEVICRLLGLLDGPECRRAIGRGEGKP